MRRSLVPAIVALAVATAATVATAPAGAAPDGPRGGRQVVAEPAELTLSKAVRILDPAARAAAAPRTLVGEHGSEHASEVLRELFESLPELEGDERDLAQRILARPSDGAADPRGYGYRTRSVKDCEKQVCVHWVRSTTDAPPSDAWAKKSLEVLDRVYRFEVGKLGFRPPVPDGRHGGNSKLDVYLKDLGTGLYGFCVPEFYKPGSRRVASGYCVIDNDFARSQFSGAPLTNLKVTLAHEFFHVVQFAYDIADDPWIYESTAVWMEERFADSINDNRQYLPLGQVRLAQIPLDTFADPGIHYGNWAWWEYLSSRYGNRIVRDVWARLDANRGQPNLYSTEGVRAVLKSLGGFPRVFGSYAAANAVPRAAYAEGEHWPETLLSGRRVLERSDRRAGFRASVDHMASRSYAVQPDRSLRGRAWRLRVKINGPSRASGPAAQVVVVKRNGTVQRRAVPLTRQGFGKATAPFSARGVKRVIVTVANASTRFTCRRGTTYSCAGVAKDDNRRFAVAVSAYK